MKMSVIASAIVGVLLLIVASGYNHAQTNITPKTTIKDIMVDVIQPLTNNLWAVAMEENKPKTDEDWQRMQQLSTQLIALSATLSLGGSGAKDNHWAAQAQWLRYSEEMMAVGEQFLQAAKAKNYQGLLDAGDSLLAPCSSCHRDFPRTGP